MNLANPARRSRSLALLLAAITFIVFSPVLRNDFIRYDDRVYVTDNPHVLSGLSLESFAWAVTTGHAHNWHPVSWLSHLLDVELFGLWPGGHHLTSLLLHVANAVLLFLLLRRLTGETWPSWIAAALFALHPLRVESVAWVAERKDVLSTLFLLLSLWHYASYARPGPGRPPTFHYRLSLVFLALGLMSKPMLVTAPALLLLLDLWPLRRLNLGPGFPGLKPILMEKVPFLVLAALSSAVTIFVQEQAQAGAVALPLLPRLANAIVSYWKYLGKFLWPADLAVFYPHPDLNYPHSTQWPAWGVALAAVALVAVTLLAVWRARKTEWFTFGWLWYLVALLPVIGIIQVGRQALADRYTYIPVIGITVMVVWGVLTLLKTRPALQPGFTACASLVLLLLSLGTVRQLGFWQNNLTLFTRALEVTSHNSVAHTMVGIELGERGDYQNAIGHFSKAIQAAPSDAEPHFGLGNTYQLLNRPADALEQFRIAVQLSPGDPGYVNRLGELLQAAGKSEEAFQCFSRALLLDPDFYLASLNLGQLLAAAGDLAQAESYFLAAVRTAPYAPEPLLRLAENYMRQGRLKDAEGRFRQLVRLYPENPDFHINLGGILWHSGRHAEALDAYREAVRLNPNYPVARYNLGITLLSLQQFPAAAEQFAEAVRLQPTHAEALTAWGRALKGMGRPDEALQRLEQSIAVRPDGFTWQQIAQVRLGQDQPAQAVAALQEALKLRPNWPPALNDLAWLKATHPDAAIRDPAQALALALTAVEVTQTNNGEFLATLDAAYALNGRFEDAIASAEKARQLAIASNRPDLATAAETRLQLYRKNEPFILPTPTR